MPTRILIAEDNAVVRTALRQLLNNAGDWEIMEVANGQQAVTRAQEHKPNLIILDLVMPVMDGLVAARELSKLMPDVPMLMHTLHWSPQVEVEAQKVGVRKVVPKADSRVLISSIQELLAAANRYIRHGSNLGNHADDSAPARTHGPAPNHGFRFREASARRQT